MYTPLYMSKDRQTLKKPNDAPTDENSRDFADRRKALLGKARGVTTAPGVYLMKNSEKRVLYVGKAKNLKNRVSSYFKAVEHDSPRIELLVRQIEIFELILTETESEALILESTLIKKYKPRFNIRLKDDKTYPYLKIRQDQDFPRIEWTRKVLKDEARYFGPFPSAWSAREVLNLLNETFQLRDCSDNTFKHRSRPCILHQIQKCCAPCVDYISVEDYWIRIRQAVEVLEGNGKQLIKEIKKCMETASANMEYEKAGQYRDQLLNLKLVTQTQGVVQAGSDVSVDVLGVAHESIHSHGVVMMVRKGKLVSLKHYQIQNVEDDSTPEEILSEFLVQYYSSHVNESGQVAVENVLVPSQLFAAKEYESAFHISIMTPKTKEEKQLVNVARANAEHSLEMSSKKSDGHGTKAVEEVAEKLQLNRLPHRIECYDISNIQGDDAVASRVVFIDGAPDKNLYRRYKIRTVEGANDFAMMKEVLGRRFSRTEEDLPDLVVVDGGVGQLNQAIAIMDELNIAGVELVGLAKSRLSGEFKDKEVVRSSERIFIPNRKNPVMLRPGTGSHGLLTHLRDEAHRFAITYHRKIRKKRTLGQ